MSDLNATIKRRSNHALSTALTIGLLLLSITNITRAGAAVAPAPDIVISNFEGSTYPAGWTTTGTAFGVGPANGTLPNQNPVSGYDGGNLINSFLGGDPSTGTLTSPNFLIKRHYVHFLIGGGSDINTVALQLLVDGKVVRQATGDNSESLESGQWNVTGLVGQSASIRVVDTATGGWGHILVDDIVESDIDNSVHGDLIARAMAAIKSAIPLASADPERPDYHFHAPAQWMNDPNGLIYYNGWYNMFYQYNPYSSDWGHMHWGHARSRDLIHWQHLPVALWPSLDRGEEHVFSGSVFQDSTGTPRAFYTSIASADAPRDPEIWSARPLDNALLRWEKLDYEPVISEANHGSVHVDEWRDPFLVRDRGIDYLVTGGEINSHGVVCLYKALDGKLTHWEFMGTLFQYPDPALKNIECPNLIKVGSTWALLISVNGQVEYFTGMADLAKCQFAVQRHGVLEHGSYASQAADNADGQPVEFAWINSVGGQGWHGCLTLPNVLSVAPDGALVATPAPSVSSLRSTSVSIVAKSLVGHLQLSKQISGNQLEVDAAIDPGTAATVGLKLPVSADGSRFIPVDYNVSTHSLSIPGLADTVIPLSATTGLLQLRIFLDHSLIDVYGDEGRVVETGAPSPSTQAATDGVDAYSTGGAAKIVHLVIYRMRSADFDLNTFH